MAFDWEKFKKGLVGEPEWADADDLSRLSIEALRLEHSGGLRRDLSSGWLRLTGPGISGHAGSIDGVADAMRHFQRLVLATGLASKGHTTLKGQPPSEVVSRTRLNLNGSPAQGSLILQIVPAALPGDEVAPDGQTGLFGDDESQLVDVAMRDALGLLDDGRELGPDADDGQFLAKVTEFGPRVATTLRDFSISLVKSDFEPDLVWLQPRRPKLRTRLTVPELAHIGEIIGSRSLEKEPTTLRGVLRTVSDLSAWQLEVEGGDIVKVDAKKIPAEETATLGTGMLVSIEVAVTEEAGPVGDPKPKFSATSFRRLDQGT